ncbi:MAG: hypothetical protein ACFFCW_25055 [Candidatus Hodarchaeota archaeon]
MQIVKSKRVMLLLISLASIFALWKEADSGLTKGEDPKMRLDR